MRALVFASLCVLVMTPYTRAAEEDPRITIRPPGLDTTPAASRAPVACDLLIRYDDGSDDFDGIGRTLGGSNNETQGILASPPVGEGPWLVQSAGFFVDFWVEPGTVDVVIRDRAAPALMTSESVFVDTDGIWEVEFSNPVCVLGDFDVILCPQPGARGVTGEDVASVDIRSFHQLQTCANTTPIHNLDLMIWACVTACNPISVERETWGTIKNLYD